MEENNNLQEPLLSEVEREEAVAKDAIEELEKGNASTIKDSSIEEENPEAPLGDDDDSTPSPSSDSEPVEFSLKGELGEMWNLGLPLAVSFFCRLTMASIDSSFVGHLHDEDVTAETYLAAAVLSDMVVSLVTVPPLAFNQVLNGLVGQAVGSNNPKMAGIWFQQSVFWLSSTMLPCLIGCFYVEEILSLLGFPAQVCKIAGIYGKYNVFWPVPNGIYQCMRFYFQAQGIPRPAMYNNILFLFVNLLLNYVFVLGGPFRWQGLGFKGAAVSLSCSRTLQPLVYFLYMFVYKKHHIRTWPGLSISNHTKERTKEFLKQSLPNVGTLIFGSISSQATTLLLGQLGEGAIAASSALSTISYPWSGTLSATATTMSSVRVGYHLGRGNAKSARYASWIVLGFLTFVTIIMFIVFLSTQNSILKIATDDIDVIRLGIPLIPAMLIGTFFNLIVSNITSGVFSGMGRPIIATILSFGFELPMSVGVVALYILKFHGTLKGFYWIGAITSIIEAIVVMVIFKISNWQKYADEARARQEASTASSPPSSSGAQNEDTTTSGETDEETSSNEPE